jgi:hypothetical protein
LTQDEYDTLERCAAEAARRLMARGYSKEEAIRIASEMAVEAIRRKYPHGMGTLPPTVPGTPDPLDEIAAKSQAAADIGVIKTMREAISPWLWVTSLIGFGMGLLNSRRIAKMYGDWRKKKGGKK